MAKYESKLRDPMRRTALLCALLLFLTACGNMPEQTDPPSPVPSESPIAPSFAPTPFRVEEVEPVTLEDAFVPYPVSGPKGQINYVMLSETDIFYVKELRMNDKTQYPDSFELIKLDRKTGEEKVLLDSVSEGLSAYYTAGWTLYGDTIYWAADVLALHQVVANQIYAFNTRTKECRMLWEIDISTAYGIAVEFQEHYHLIWRQNQEGESVEVRDMETGEVQTFADITIHGMPHIRNGKMLYAAEHVEIFKDKTFRYVKFTTYDLAQKKIVSQFSANTEASGFRLGDGFAVWRAGYSNDSECYIHDASGTHRLLAFDEARPRTRLEVYGHRIIAEYAAEQKTELLFIEHDQGKAYTVTLKIDVYECFLSGGWAAYRAKNEKGQTETLYVFDGSRIAQE